VLTLFVTVLASAHVILNKRDSRAAVGWVGVIWLAPVLGAVLYVLFGINRIRRRASLLRDYLPRPGSEGIEDSATRGRLAERLPPKRHHLLSLGKLVDRVAVTPLVEGNRVDPLVDGDQAYPAMLEAIGRAQASVVLATYIFDRDQVGLIFADALAQAAGRGVEVRVLVDGVGARYSYPSMVGELRQRGVKTARFLPTLVPWHLWSLNLRNHKKLLVVDGKLGFTGGMNIREGHRLDWSPSHPVRDLHFRVQGPVVRQLMESFAFDWAFATGELLKHAPWFVPPEPAGEVLARGIPDGPDEDFERLQWVLHGAVSTARESIRILTPYFLPERGLIRALNTAALRGVKVEILLPGRNNVRLVQWATTAMLWQLLEHGCRVYLSPPPFDHAKLMLVDDAWSLLGSANWDARSLRLNFEFNLECYDARLAAELKAIFERRLAAARPVTLAEVDGRSIPVRLRDGLARLASPYL
jgi:cardiolipin synthase